MKTLLSCESTACKLQNINRLILKIQVKMKAYNNFFFYLECDGSYNDVWTKQLESFSHFKFATLWDVNINLESVLQWMLNFANFNSIICS